MERIKFAELDKKIQEGRCTIPQAVFVTLNPDDETFEQVVERQEKFLKLPENIKDKLVAPQTAEKIKSIGAHYGLELLQMAPIARAIRSYYFGELKLENFVEVIKEESKIPEEEARGIYEYILNGIINKEVTVENTVKKEKMTIGQALEKYPVIKRKLLTSLPIEINRINVSPTIENWISDYFATVGAGNRDVMKRSSYLYHSKNAKGLNMIDRQKLSLVLKSLDEGFLLDIDINRSEIIFDLVQTENKNNFVSEINNKKNDLVDYRKPVSQKREVEVAEKTEKAPLANKRFLDGFSGMEKKEIKKSETNEISAAKSEERIEKANEPNLLNNINGVNKKSGRFGFLIGNKKRDDFDKKIPENKNISKGTITFFEEPVLEKNESLKKENESNNVSTQDIKLQDKKDENNRMVIKHVSGNNWDLGSAHFLEKDGDNKKNTSRFNIFKKDDDRDVDAKSPVSKPEEGIKFTFPQQLPVEKENNKIGSAAKNKTEELGSFFGKIRPIE